MPVSEPATQSMSQYTQARRLSMADAKGGFAIGPSEVLVQVHGEMLTRLDGWSPPGAR